MDSPRQKLSLKYAVEVASEKHIDGIIETTNDAFMADAFFKKPEYHPRFTRSDVVTMIATPDAAFLVAITRDSSAVDDIDIIVGSIFVTWHAERTDSTAKVSST